MIWAAAVGCGRAATDRPHQTIGNSWLVRYLSVMTDRYESWIDRQVRAAQERGDFDNLPGAGKPLPDHNELYDEDWWLKGLIHREDLSAALPTTLALRREIETLARLAATKTSEPAVRRMVADLNHRIAKARLGPVDGPPMVLNTVDVEDVVREWRERRRGRTP